MKEYMQSLPDGWTIYLWMVAAAGILIGAAFLLRWGFKNNQFDEDIKYVVLMMTTLIKCQMKILRNTKKS